MGSVSDNNKFFFHTNRSNDLFEIGHNHHNGLSNADIDSPLTEPDLDRLFDTCDDPAAFVATMRQIAPKSTSKQSDAEIAYARMTFIVTRRSARRSML